VELFSGRRLVSFRILYVNWKLYVNPVKSWFRFFQGSNEGNSGKDGCGGGGSEAGGKARVGSARAARKKCRKDGGGKADGGGN
jgi:hypothetical protein